MSEISNPAYCFFTAPLVEYVKILGTIIYFFVESGLKNITFHQFYIGSNYILIYFIFFSITAFATEVFCRFTVFNIFMDLLRFVKHKVLISLIITSIFSGVVYFLNYNLLIYHYYKYSNDSYYYHYYFYSLLRPPALVVITQLVTGGVIGFYYNVIYFNTGNMWICIILNSIFNYTSYIEALDRFKAYLFVYIYIGIALVYSILLYLNIINWFKKPEQIDNEIQNFFLTTTNKNQFE